MYPATPLAVLGFHASFTLCSARLRGQNASPKTMAKLRTALRPRTFANPFFDILSRIITLFSSRSAKLPPVRGGGRDVSIIGFPGPVRACF